MNRKTVKILRNVVVVAVIVCGLTWVCSKFVHLGDVEYTDNAQIRRNMIPINSRVQGFIEKVCFDDFQFVHAGDTLVVIECSEYELKVAQAKANYQKAVMENTARETAISTTANNLTVSDANIEELRIRLDQTHNDFLRYEQLYGQKAVTRQQYDNAKADYEATKAKYDMLVRSKRSTALMKDEQTRRLEQNQTNIDVARAEQHLAELNLSYTVIVAPCDGVTGRRQIDEGQLVQPGQTLLDVVDSGEVWVTANYRETQLPYIAVGADVEMTVDAVPDVTYHGVVESVSDATGAAFSLIPQDNATGNFVKVEQRVPVRIRLEGNDAEAMSQLRAGLNVECKVRY